jgi:hypothetical protein
MSARRRGISQGVVPKMLEFALEVPALLGQHEARTKSADLELPHPDRRADRERRRVDVLTPTAGPHPGRAVINNCAEHVHYQKRTSGKIRPFGVAGGCCLCEGGLGRPMWSSHGCPAQAGRCTSCTYVRRQCPRTGRNGPVRSDAATTWVVRCLLEKVRADTYPSATELDLIENVIPCSMLGEYIEVLLDKTGKDRYPSIWLLRRIGRVIE